MEYWSVAPESRGQMVLFATKLDEVLEAAHPVRMLEGILARLDWSVWEAGYHLKRGQPPIHPRVLAGVILYGLFTRIRSSRGLEEALRVRLDFRWLVEGVGREDRLHPFHRERSARVETGHARVRHRAAEQLREQHALDPVVLGVLRCAGDFGD